jgi:hypothetical protein
VGTPRGVYGRLVVLANVLALIMLVHHWPQRREGAYGGHPRPRYRRVAASLQEGYRSTKTTLVVKVVRGGDDKGQLGSPVLGPYSALPFDSAAVSRT